MKPTSAQVHRRTEWDGAGSFPVWAVFFVLFLLLSGGLFPALAAETEEPGKDLGKSGIRYPEGFDVNTVGEVKGTVRNLSYPPMGPVTFLLRAAGEEYFVIVSPSWFLRELQVKINEGEEIRVVGSKALGRDGKLYVIARQLQPAGAAKAVSVRGSDGVPLWRMPGGGPQGGHGPGGMGPGGMGPGGMGPGGARGSR